MRVRLQGWFAIARSRTEGPVIGASQKVALCAQLAESDTIGYMQTYHLSQESAFRRVLGMVRGSLAGVCGGQRC